MLMNDSYYILGYDIGREGDMSPYRPNIDENMDIYYNSLHSTHQYLNDWDSGLPHEVLLHMKEPKKRPKVIIYKEEE